MPNNNEFIDIKKELSTVLEILDLVVQQTDTRSTGIVEKFYAFSAKMDQRERERWKWLWGIIAGIILILLVTGFGVYQTQISQIHEIEKKVIEINHSVQDIKKGLNGQFWERKLLEKDNKNIIQKNLW